MTDRPLFSSLLTHSKLLLLTSLLIFFFSLSLSEFLTYRRFLLRPLPDTNITITNPPPDSSSLTPQISWRVSAPSTNLLSTAIYYDYLSTPSALLTSDSPQAVGYQFHTSDYSLGSFPAPATFIATLPLPHSGTIYYRAHANLNGLNLWSPEFTLRLK